MWNLEENGIGSGHEYIELYREHPAIDISYHGLRIKRITTEAGIMFAMEHE